jgi:hypothetical protein
VNAMHTMQNTLAQVRSRDKKERNAIVVQGKEGIEGKQSKHGEI